MVPDLQVTYLQHSGFAVTIGDVLLIFDDAQGLGGDEDSLQNGRITRECLGAYRHAVFFVSHAHNDHFNSRIYSAVNAGDVAYVLGFDVPPPYFDAIQMHPGDTATLFDQLEITAYDSTDEGVSFMVRLDGWTLFHAGDLNLWHWRQESTLKEIEQAEKDYLQAVAPLVDQKIDLAFFPLDPRMGDLYDAGAQHFLMHIKPQVFVPMHWWDRSDAAIGFARRNRTKRTEIIALTQPGQLLRLQKGHDGAVHVDA